MELRFDSIVFAAIEASGFSSPGKRRVIRDYDEISVVEIVKMGFNGKEPDFLEMEGI